MFVGHLSADNRGHSPPLSSQQVNLPLRPLLITRPAYICGLPLTAMSVECRSSGVTRGAGRSRAVPAASSALLPGLGRRLRSCTSAVSVVVTRHARPRQRYSRRARRGPSRRGSKLESGSACRAEEFVLQRATPPFHTSSPINRWRPTTTARRRAHRAGCGAGIRRLGVAYVALFDPVGVRR
jgi:hypothetical protein